MTFTRLPLIVSLFLALAGLFILISFIAFVVTDSTDVVWFTTPGGWLFQSFHFFGVVLPVFLLVAALLLLLKQFKPYIIITSVLSVIPFLSLSVVFRLLFDPFYYRSPVTLAVQTAFTRYGGAALFFLLSVLTIMGCLWVNKLLRNLIPDLETLFAGPAGWKRNVSELQDAYGAAEGFQDRERAEDLSKGRMDTSPIFGEGSILSEYVQAQTEGSSVGPEQLEEDTAALFDEPEELNEPEDDLEFGDVGPDRQQASGTFVEAVGVEELEVIDDSIVVKPETIDMEDLEVVDDSIVLRANDHEVEEEVISIPSIAALQPGSEAFEPAAELNIPEKAEYVENEEVESIESNEEDDYISESEIQQQEETIVSEPVVQAPIIRERKRREYTVPIEGILNQYDGNDYWNIDDDTREAAEALRDTLEEFRIQAEVTGIRKGPVITMFEILPAPGVKLSKIVNLADNIALRLAASSVRIVAPIPGKQAVGIEIPNRERAIVTFAEMISEKSFKDEKLKIPVVLGKDIAGGTQIIDLAQTPHLLIAGATGSGKSVCVNSIICSILYRKTPQEVKLLLIDPKIVELKFYNDIPHLLTPVITEPKRAFQALQYCLYEMERRYSLLDGLGVRDLASYNRKIEKQKLAQEPLPYIVIIVDEFADLMATTGKELESTIARLAAMSRAVGMHIVLATQRPSIDVITGLIKANIPSRIAFMVAGKFDSRIIIDSVGAEKLLGKGDMLFTSSWAPFPVRMQGAFLSEEEVENIVDHVKTLGEPEYIDDEIFIDDEEIDTFQQELEDPLMEKAIEIVVSANKASASYLQRRLKIGYNRAARLVEEMERIGVVGPQNGSKPRDIISVPEDYLNN